MGRGAGNIIYESLGGPVEKYGPGGPSLGLKEDILSLEIVYFCIFGGAAKLRGARSAPFGMVIRPIRRVRAVHGRARADKTH